jgi:hypothetical protein
MSILDTDPGYGGTLVLTLDEWEFLNEPTTRATVIRQVPLVVALVQPAIQDDGRVMFDDGNAEVVFEDRVTGSWPNLMNDGKLDNQ